MGDADSFYGANKCIDGSRATHCSGSKSYKGDNWLSVMVDGGTPVGFVEVYVYLGERETAKLAPFNVWVGSAYGDTDSASAVRCADALVDVQQESVLREPKGGAPVLLACGAAPHYVFTVCEV